MCELGEDKYHVQIVLAFSGALTMLTLVCVWFLFRGKIQPIEALPQAV